MRYTIDDVTETMIAEALEAEVVDHMVASAARRGNQRAMQKIADEMNRRDEVVPLHT